MRFEIFRNLKLRSFLKTVRASIVPIINLKKVENCEILFDIPDVFTTNKKRKYEYYDSIIKPLSKDKTVSEIISVYNKPLLFAQKPLKYIYIEKFFKLKHLSKIKKIAKRPEFQALEKHSKINNIYDIVLYYTIYYEAFKKIKPKKVVIMNSPLGITYAMHLAAKDLNITSIEIQHGIIHKNHPAYIIPERYRSTYTLPNYLLSYGTYEKKLITNNSIWGENQVIPIGCSRYDFLANYKVDENKLRKKYDISEDKKILFWATNSFDPITYNNGEREQSADEIFSTIKNNDDWHLIIKFHPNEDYNSSFKFYEHYKNKYDLENCTILGFEEINTYDCIAISDCFISRGSTVGMEAILMNKPVVNIELIESWDLSMFKELNSSLIINKKGDLENFLNLINTEEYLNKFKRDRENYLQLHFNNFGTATEKIVEFIKNC
ncbi:CDP-glycerol glycerophosphotransferase (TagB/SpsB family) [Methanococcus voltae]|uniref:CDP-glycerol glycerophosphotransferase (TagB/SpsB family) n=1 Tax=Methanococcus voltae TaxID=2188 RepID=A0A8J7RDT6_METVO|nr:hypothetical protein [Methanococcus voltae]MBP2201422.1 CDP-glycerol glycerophosphotransferase (TagB/SpsB family) [Methanococcus voltae]